MKVPDLMLHFSYINTNFSLILIHLHVPQATTLFTRPQSSASFASIDLPVNMSSKALDKPTQACKRTVPPSMSGTPMIIKLNIFIIFK